MIEMIKLVTTYILLALTSQLNAKTCSFDGDLTFISSEQVSHLDKDLIVVVKTPILEDFAHDFPESVNIKGNLKGYCDQTNISLKIYMRKVASPTNEGKKGPRLFKPFFIKKPLFSKRYLKSITNTKFTLNEVPHEKLYNSITTDDFWYDQVKYVIELKHKVSGKTLDLKTKVLLSPMHD
jgi:hypothetical protein